MKKPNKIFNYEEMIFKYGNEIPQEEVLKLFMEMQPKFTKILNEYATKMGPNNFFLIYQSIVGSFLASFLSVIHKDHRIQTATYLSSSAIKSIEEMEG